MAGLGHYVVSNVLWYIEFFAFIIVLTCFFIYFLYLLKLDKHKYSSRFDFKKKWYLGYLVTMGPKKPSTLNLKPLHTEQRQTPICCDPGCVWFCRLVSSVATIAACFAFAYSLISVTKLKFGLFLP